MAMTPEIIMLTIFAGSIIGLFLGAFGGGGSVFAVPLLLFLVGVDDTHLAIGTSAAAVAAIALFNLLGHWRGGAVKWPCASVFAGAGILGSYIGSSLAKLVDGQSLLMGFAVIMALIGLSMFRKRSKEGNPDVRITLKLMLSLVPIGLTVGIAAGFFGIGGGFLIVPGLILATGMTMSNATASSLISVTIFGAVTSANYALSGWVDIRLTGLLLAGGMLGGLLGISISRLLTQRAALARKSFAGLILAVAVYVGVQAV